MNEHTKDSVSIFDSVPTFVLSCGEREVEEEEELLIMRYGDRQGPALIPLSLV